MSPRIAFLIACAVAWGCTDAARPVAPSSTTAVAHTSADDVGATATFTGRRGVARFEAYIDGRSELQIGGYGNSLVRWWHFDFAAPGRLLGANFPTRINDVDWYPEWPDIPDPENRDCNCGSSTTTHTIPFWPLTYDVDPQVIAGRGIVTFAAGIGWTIEFNDNGPPGADWYAVTLDSRFPLAAQPYPAASPYLVSRSRDRFVSLALLSFGAAGLDNPAGLTDVSLGNDRGAEAGVARTSAGDPLVDIRDVNGDSMDDLIVRFRVAALAYNGDAPLGSVVLRVTARSPGWGFVRGDLPVTFVP